MQKFEVVITEVLQKTVTVSAASKEEAERIAETGWKNADYLLDADNFKEVLFSMRRDQAMESFWFIFGFVATIVAIVATEQITERCRKREKR